MRPRLVSLAALVVLAAVAAGCGGNDDDKVDTATYTCAQFQKSLATKDDTTSGNFINQLRKDADLGQAEKTERRTLALAIFFACRGKPGTTKPATQAVAYAKQIRAGKFKAPAPPQDKKKSTE